MKRRKHTVDLRPSWRDPAMPVLAQHATKGLIAISPERMQRVAEFRMNQTVIPDYKADPTYNLRKK